MFPIILKIGPVTIYSYGLLLALAVVVGSYLMGREAKQEGLEPQLMYDFIFWCMIGGIVGARIFFIILNWQYYLGHPLEIIMLSKGGLAFQGGLVLGTAAGFIFVIKKKLPLPLMLDFAGIYLAFGQAVGRIGCFLNGCCYGKESPHGIYFPAHAAKLIPTQAFDSVGLFIIFAFLFFYRRRSSAPGTTFGLYLIFASILRFAVQFFRADDEVLFLNLGLFQIVSIVFCLTGIYAYTFFKSRARKR